MKTIYRINSTERMTVWALIAILVTISSFVNAQTNAPKKYRQFAPTYNFKGYAVGASVGAYTLQSNIPQLKDLSVRYEGGYIGMIHGNSYGFIRSSIGIYYSSASTPYSIDVLAGSLSANNYIFKWLNINSQSFQPYISLKATALQSTYFGNYLDKDKVNMSVGKEKRIGRTLSAQGMIGIGVMYQLENTSSHFVNLFAEVSYGTSFLTKTRNIDLAQTQMKRPMIVTLGITFGNNR